MTTPPNPQRVGAYLGRRRYEYKRGAVATFQGNVRPNGSGSPEANVPDANGTAMRPTDIAVGPLDEMKMLYIETSRTHRTPGYRSWRAFDASRQSRTPSCQSGRRRPKVRSNREQSSVQFAGRIDRDA